MSAPTHDEAATCADWGRWCQDRAVEAIARKDYPEAKAWLGVADDFLATAFEEITRADALRRMEARLAGRGA